MMISPWPGVMMIIVMNMSFILHSGHGKNTFFSIFVLIVDPVESPKSLLIGWNAFTILDLLFHVFDGVGGLHFQSNGLPSECFLLQGPFLSERE